MSVTVTTELTFTGLRDSLIFSETDRKHRRYKQKGKNMASGHDQKKGGDKSSNLMRRPFLYIFSLLILVIIVVTFIGGPAVRGRYGTGTLVFGKYKNEEIKYTPGNYFARQYQTIAEQFKNQNQNQQGDIQSQLRTIWRQAFNRTLFHHAILDQAAQSGMTVSENKVDEELVQYPAFQDNGQFSAKLYRQMSSQDKFSLRQYLKTTLIHDQYVQDKLMGLKTSSKEVAFIQGMSGPERKFSLAAFSYADYPRDRVVSYAQEHKKLFQRINLSSITILSSEKDAENIRQQILDRTSTFEDLARAHSKDVFAEKGGDMGWTYYYELSRDYEDPAVLEKVFSLKAGDISPVLKTRNGWVIYRIDDPAVAIDPAGDDAVKTVRSYITSFDRGKVEDYLREQASTLKKDAASTSFSEAIARSGASRAETSYFAINYGNLPFFGTVSSPDGDYLRSAAYQENFFTTAYRLTGTEVSDPIVLQDHVAVMQLADERTPNQDTTNFLKTYYPYVVQQFEAEEVQRVLLNPKFITDNFNSAFNRYVLGQS